MMNARPSLVNIPTGRFHHHQRYPTMRFTPISILVLLAAAGCGGGNPVDPAHDMHDAASLLGVAAYNSPEVNAGLAEIRKVTARFHDLDAATAAGYTVWAPNPNAVGATCPSNSEGLMGYHRVNVSLRGGAANPAAGDAVIDPLRPEMLLYEKMPNGKLKLVGVEYLVFKAAWEAANGTGAPPPSVLGQPLLFSSHAFPGGTGNIDHYELHVWIWSPNSLGMFYPWNPGISC